MRSAITRWLKQVYTQGNNKWWKKSKVGSFQIRGATVCKKISK